MRIVHIGTHETLEQALCGLEARLAFMWERSLHIVDGLDGIKVRGKKKYVFNLYIYSHGAVKYSLAPFSCQWDSAKCGEITAYGKNAEMVAEAIVSTLNQYMNNDYYDVMDDEDECIECGVTLSEALKVAPGAKVDY
jgi:hypothetical protein